MPAVLVTGAAGVLGRAIVARLGREGRRIVCLDRTPEPPDMSRHGVSVTWETADITDWAALQGCLEKHDVDMAVHTAAFVNRAAAYAPREAVQVNVCGSANLLELGRINGWKRIVSLSSRTVYGDVERPYCHPEYKPVSEDHPCRPASIYAATKRSVELIAEKFASDFGVSTISLRCSAIYGPGKTGGHGVSSIFSNAIEAAQDGCPIEIGGADQAEDLIYSPDVAKAVSLALDHAMADGLRSDVFNIGSGTAVTIAEFSRLLDRMTGTKTPTFPGTGLMSRPFSQSYVLDGERARALLGFVPDFSLEDGIADYIANLEGRAS